MRRPARIIRELTTGEVALAARVFGAALAVEHVRVHNRPYLPGQARGVAMAPNGQVWFHHEDYRPDFSVAPGLSAWLVHELTHAWQHQSGRSVRRRGLLEQLGRLVGRDPYRYGQLDPARPFHSYTNEQQATIVEDAFRLSHGLNPRFGTGTAADYAAAVPFTSALSA